MSCECCACYECYLAHFREEEELQELLKYEIKDVTVAEFIEFLKRFDQGAIVCLENQHRNPETSISLEKFGDFLFIS